MITKLRSLSILVLALAAFASCSPSTDPSGTGIEGYVQYGPTRPIMLNDGKDYLPLPNAPLEILDQNGKIVSTVHTDANGNYRAIVSEGDYYVLPMNLEDPNPYCWPPMPNDPMPVSVSNGSMSRIDVTYMTYLKSAQR
jgi:hypothetical protein